MMIWTKKIWGLLSKNCYQQIFCNYYHLGIGVSAGQNRICRNLATIWLRQSAFVRACIGCLCSIFKENQTSGMYALDSYGIYDGSNLYRIVFNYNKT